MQGAEVPGAGELRLTWNASERKHLRGCCCDLHVPMLKQQAGCAFVRG